MRSSSATGRLSGFLLRNLFHRQFHPEGTPLPRAFGKCAHVAAVILHHALGKIGADAHAVGVAGFGFLGAAETENKFMQRLQALLLRVFALLCLP